METSNWTQNNTTTKDKTLVKRKAVKKGVEKAHEALVMQRNTLEPYALKVYSDNMAVVTAFRNPDLLSRPNLTEEQCNKKAEAQKINKENNQTTRREIQNKGIEKGFGNINNKE
eukprot:GHVR01168432.1.p2 GENE.GHVR01168432.1~~GHVR01168432.1.p2  ORF type:complete len:114 (+),score=16.78 GHVR01168432.1:133-474(+)